MASIGWTEILIILVIVLLLFGANKLPDLARSMGRSARIFKSEVKEMKKDGDPNVTVNGQPAADGQPVAGAPAQQAAPAQPAAPVQPQATQQAPVVDQNQRPNA